MPEWKEEKERIRHLIREGKLTDEMKVKLVIPALDARKRIQNREKQRQVRFNCDEQTYSEFSAIREAWMLELGQNPVLVAHAMIVAMGTFDLRGWKESQESSGIPKAIIPRGDI